MFESPYHVSTDSTHRINWWLLSWVSKVSLFSTSKRLNCWRNLQINFKDIVCYSSVYRSIDDWITWPHFLLLYLKTHHSRSTFQSRDCCDQSKAYNSSNYLTHNMLWNERRNKSNKSNNNNIIIIIIIIIIMIIVNVATTYTLVLSW